MKEKMPARAMRKLFMLVGPLFKVNENGPIEGMPADIFGAA